jgi:ABC-2 type transport system permease protein
MNNLTQAVWVETLKARRSKMPLLTALGIVLIPLAGGFFMVVIKDPDLAQRMGLISAKAHIMMGAADWPTYLNFLAIALAAGGLMFFSFIATWVFGREYSDRTVKDLLALPTSRSSIVCAKFIVVASWTALLSLLMLLVGYIVGLAVILPSVEMQVYLQGGITLLITAILTIILVTPIAYIASAGHGYLPPMAFALFSMALAQLVGVAGWGEFFPWAIPAIYAQGQNLGMVSYLIVILTGLAGLGATFAWWRLADQTH